MFIDPAYSFFLFIVFDTETRKCLFGMIETMDLPRSNCNAAGRLGMFCGRSFLSSGMRFDLCFHPTIKLFSLFFHIQLVFGRSGTNNRLRAGVDQKNRTYGCQRRT
jgi:hypothetical protein